MSNMPEVTNPWGFMGNKDMAPHANPYYTYSQVFSPKTLKNLLKWCEFLFVQSPHIYAALRKFGEYPITEITYESPNPSLRKRHKQLLEKTLRVREILINMTLDKYIYGNAFLSMYQPFIRYLRCPYCKNSINIKNIGYEFDYQSVTFKFKCKTCEREVTATEEDVQDRKLAVAKLINFIRWDPKLIDIDYNVITGKSEYYYSIPESMKSLIKSGHKTLIDSMPMGFLKTVKEDTQFKFAPNQLFHMKIGGPAGVNPQWGLPPLLSALQLFHYTAVLRKANEAIAQDYLVPFRVLHPAQASGNADPILRISLENWKNEVNAGLKEWRKDPLFIMTAPIPVGVTQIGGQGRALLTLGEIQEAEKALVAALGIPIEFLYGGLTGSGMEATLRLIENQLQTHVGDVKDLLQWVDDSCSKFLGWQNMETDMVPFKMVDDTINKQLVAQLYQQGLATGKKLVSNNTLAKYLNLDLDQEQNRIKQETLDEMRQQNEMQVEVNKIQSNVAQQIQMQAQQQAGGVAYDTPSIIQQADQYVQQLVGLTDPERKSQLRALQIDDFVMYSVVIQRWEEYRNRRKTELAQNADRQG